MGYMNQEHFHRGSCHVLPSFKPIYPPIPSCILLIPWRLVNLMLEHPAYCEK
jgi:hypothetical protein